MNLEITGKLIEKGDTQNVTDSFKKREFVLELADESGMGYVNYAKMQLVQAKCDVLDRFNVGDNLRVAFNIRGRRTNDGRYFSNLDAWRIDLADNNAGGAPNQGGYQQGGYNQGGQQGGYNQGGFNQGGGYNQGNFQGNQGGFNNQGGFQQNAPAGNYGNANQGGSDQGGGSTDDLPF